MATHSSILAWKIPWMEEPGRLQSMGSQRVRHDSATSLSLSLSRVFAASRARLLSFNVSSLLEKCGVIWAPTREAGGGWNYCRGLSDARTWMLACCLGICGGLGSVAGVGRGWVGGQAGRWPLWSQAAPGIQGRGQQLRRRGGGSHGSSTASQAALPSSEEGLRRLQGWWLTALLGIPSKLFGGVPPGQLCWDGWKGVAVNMENE